MWNLIEFQCGNIRGQPQPHISYRILSFDDMDITIKSKSMGRTKMKAINWLEEVGDFNVKARTSIQDMNTKHTAQTPCFTLNLVSLFTF